jgi:DNA mismatch repair protein MutL
LIDIIQMLPDNVANQIAAGEVIQRPASAVKELLENSVDANASFVQLLLQDAGKGLIQVIDNGKGMSATDARLCFEKHATSKIQKVDDLFNISTMGFRGEALASIAAVARVELKTKLSQQDAGTYIEIEDSTVKKQEPCATITGTSIAVKNLFFNIPARRNFLKSTTTELKNCIDEFIRVALSFPHIGFSMHHNDALVYQMQGGSLKQRITQIFGNSYNTKMVSINDQTDYLNIEGFIGKPEAAKKTRGDQFFIVNNRFIKSPYLNHAIMGAYKDLLQPETFPFYVIKITIDAAQIDVNVHPTKQEIKFEDDKIVYAFLQACIKRALAQYSIAPTLEFDLDNNIQQLDAITNPLDKQRIHAAGSSYLSQSFSEKNKAHFIEPTNSAAAAAWKSHTFPQLKENLHQLTQQQKTTQNTPVFEEKNYWAAEEVLMYNIQQRFNTYIEIEVGSNLFIYHQQYVHQRILFERSMLAFQKNAIAIQPSLFPNTIETSPGDAVLLKEILPLLKTLGYHIEEFGNNSFIVHGTPAHSNDSIEQEHIEEILEAIKHEAAINTEVRYKTLATIFSKRQSIKIGKKLSLPEMQELITQLWQCNQPHITATGKKVFHIIAKNHWDNLFL